MHWTRWSCSMVIGCGIFVNAVRAHAQAALPPAPAASNPSPPAVNACFPSCRAGYLCAEGKCIQACNPPCPDGQACTASAQCVAVMAPPVVAPASPGPAAPGPAPAYAYPPPGYAGAPVPGGPGDGPYTPVPKGVRVHDGFYFRMALGIGALSASYRGDFSGAPKYDVSGVAVLDELTFGGTPSPGVVVGGGIFGSTTLSPTIDVDGTKLETGSIGAGVVAPFVDVYPNPQTGLHLQGALGLAVLTASEGDPEQICYAAPINACATSRVPADDYIGAGLGIVVGVGYEGWVGEQWSIGGLARLTYVSGTMSAVNDTSRSDLKVNGVLPGALMTITYH